MGSWRARLGFGVPGQWVDASIKPLICDWGQHWRGISVRDEHDLQGKPELCSVQHGDVQGGGSDCSSSVSRLPILSEVADGYNPTGWVELAYGSLVLKGGWG